MRRMLLVLVLVASACTSSRQTTADLSQAAKYDQAAATMASAVAQYRQVAISATTPADCAAALQQYVASIQPALDQMRSLAGRMDSYMRSAANTMAGDMECGVEVISDELAHHQAVACANSDMDANRAEAQRHCAAMQSFADHMQMRAVQAGEMMSQGGMVGAPNQTMDAGWMVGWSDGGWMIPDGGMLGFDQPMPGCTYASGGYSPPDGGYWMDGGWVTGGPGPVMDGGVGPPADGGTFNGGLAGGATRCAPPARCAGPMPMMPNYLCPDGTVAGPACVAMPDGTCAWRILTCS